MKYPIGTKIRFVENCPMHNEARKDVGIVGVVVGDDMGGWLLIYLPSSTNNVGGKVTWITQWENCVPISEENKQMLFPFMVED